MRFSDSMNSAAIWETDFPRRRASVLAFLTSASSIRKVSFVFMMYFLKLMSSARLVLADSGGIQEETAVLDVPRLTLRENTERPCTAEMGSNRLVGTDPVRILDAYDKIQNGGARAGADTAVVGWASG